MLFTKGRFGKRIPLISREPALYKLTKYFNLPIMLREMKDCKMRAGTPTVETVSREESKNNELQWSAMRNVNVTLV